MDRSQINPASIQDRPPSAERLRVGPRSPRAGPDRSRLYRRAGRPRVDPEPILIEPTWIRMGPVSIPGSTRTDTPPIQDRLPAATPDGPRANPEMVRIDPGQTADCESIPVGRAGSTPVDRAATAGRPRVEPAPIRGRPGSTRMHSGSVLTTRSSGRSRIAPWSTPDRPPTTGRRWIDPGSTSIDSRPGVDLRSTRSRSLIDSWSTPG